MEFEYWPAHVDAARKGEAAFRQFLEACIRERPELHVVTMSVQNSQADAVKLMLEPSSITYDMPSGATYRIVAAEAKGYTPSVAVEPGYIVVWGRDLSGMEAFHDGAALFPPQVENSNSEG